MPDGSQKKISELPVAPAAHPTDLLETSQADGTGYVSRSITLAQVAAGVVAPPPAWTDITGKPATFPPTLPIAESDVTNLVSDLAGKAPTSHTHTASQTTDFSEAVDDRVAALLVAGANVTLTYNDPANTLTIASTAAGGGGGTVTSTSVVSANGLAGTVATPTTTPAITLSTTISGLLKGNGTAISAGVAGTDFVSPSGLTTALGNYLPLAGGTLTGPLTGTSSSWTVPANTAAFTATGYSLTGSNATGCFGITATLNTTGQPDIFAINVTDTSNSGGNAFVIRGGPSGTASLIRTTMSGDTRVAGWCQARLNDALVTNGADYFAYYLGNGSGGNIGLFAGLSNPTFSTFGRYGSIYLNGASPGIPYYNANGTTGWDRLVGETSTQTITGKTFGATTFTGAVTGTTATFSGAVATDTEIWGPSVTRGELSYTTGAAIVRSKGTTQLRLNYGDGSGGVAIYDGGGGMGALTGGTATFTGTVSAPGAQIQMVSTETGAVATGTTQIPVDDTIPQQTEGDQYMTLAITPRSATSKLIIEVVGNFGISTQPFQLTMALFQDATANALAAVGMIVQTAALAGPMKLTHIMTSGTTSATTFKVRAGANGALTTTFNGFGAGRMYGGVMASSIVIREVA